MLFLLIITPIVHFLHAKTKFTITRIIIVLLQEIIQTMIWKRIYANRTQWFSYFLRDFAFKKKSPILPIIYETKRGIKIRNKNYSFLCINNQKGHLFVYNYVTNKTYTYERRCP